MARFQNLLLLSSKYKRIKSPLYEKQNLETIPKSKFFDTKYFDVGYVMITVFRIIIAYKTKTVTRR